VTGTIAVASREKGESLGWKWLTIGGAQRVELSSGSFTGMDAERIRDPVA
jgi:hypothetical protein